MKAIYEVNNNQVKDVQGTHYDNVAMGQRFLREYNYMANILLVTLLSVFGSPYKIGLKKNRLQIEIKKDLYSSWTLFWYKLSHGTATKNDIKDQVSVIKVFMLIVKNMEEWIQ